MRVTSIRPQFPIFLSPLHPPPSLTSRDSKPLAYVFFFLGISWMFCAFSLWSWYANKQSICRRDWRRIVEIRITDHSTNYGTATHMQTDQSALCCEQHNTVGRFSHYAAETPDIHSPKCVHALCTFVMLSHRAVDKPVFNTFLNTAKWTCWKTQKITLSRSTMKLFKTLKATKIWSR